MYQGLMFAQVGVGTLAPDASAELDVSSGTRGMLIPRMTSTDRIAIASPAMGLLVFDKSTGSFWFYTGSAWEDLSAAPSALLADADNNTKVQVEESPDENIIRFDLAGSERWVMNGYALEPKNFSQSVFIGVNTGMNLSLVVHSSVFVGYEAGKANTSGAFNVGIGYQAFLNNTSGSKNSALGYFSLQNNTIGGSNTAIGYLSLNNNTEGGNNVAIGQNALNTNTLGNNNIAIGVNADVMSVSLSNAIAIGYKAKVASSNSLILGSTGSYAVNVGIGTTTPLNVLDVQGKNTTSTVANIEVTYTGNVHVRGLNVISKPNDGFGTGTYSIGGNKGIVGIGEGGASIDQAIGVYGAATGTAGTRFGVWGDATGSALKNFGVYGSAFGTGTTNYGIYGSAGNATTSWAGYFDFGNVYVKNLLGIGTLTPLNVLDVHGNASNNTVANIEVTYTGNTNVTGLNVYSKPADGYGTGIYTRGGSIGINGIGIGGAGTGQSIGVKGTATGTSGSRYGVFGEAASTGSYNYGVYGTAKNATSNNWAGYFKSGNVFIENRLGLNVLSPTSPIDIDATSTKSINIKQITNLGYTYAIDISVENTNPSTTFYACYGVQIVSKKSIGKGDVYGIRTTADNSSSTGSSNAIGSWNYSYRDIAAASSICYGTYGRAAGNSGKAYGIYGSIAASNAAVKYGGYFSGDVYTTGSYLPSDEKLKTGIEKYNNALNKIVQLKTKQYQYDTQKYPYFNFPEGQQIGFLAGDLKEVFPQLVKASYQPEVTMPLEDAQSMGVAYTVNEEGMALLADGLAFDVVNYTGLIPVLVQSIQEQQILIEAQQKQIDELKKLITQK